MRLRGLLDERAAVEAHTRLAGRESWPDKSTAHFDEMAASAAERLPQVDEQIRLVEAELAALR
jgi:hypothetical protein